MDMEYVSADDAEASVAALEFFEAYRANPIVTIELDFCLISCHSDLYRVRRRRSLLAFALPLCLALCVVHLHMPELVHEGLM